MNARVRFSLATVLGVAGFLGTATGALAGPIPVLTAQGISLGFTLDVIVSGMPTDNGNSYDVLGSAINSDGNIIVNNSRTAQNYVFKDVNNQTPADALNVSTFGGFASALAYSNGSVWASANGGRLAKLNNDGSINTVYPTIVANQGLWTNPTNGHLLAGNPLYDINVSGPSPVETLLNGAFFADGLTVSPDGHWVYGSSGQIVDLTNPSAPPTSFGFVSGADGMGVIAAANPLLDGDIIVNTTSGNIVLVDHITFAQTILATGGGYGDYVSPDRNNGSLMVSSSNNLLRLSCGPNCTIGEPAPGVPEPASFALLGSGIVAFGLFGRRRVKKDRV